MKRNTYVRLQFYTRPSEDTTGPLARAVESAVLLGMIQGRLLDDVRLRQGIHLQADYRNGASTIEKISSRPVLRIEPGYILTRDSLYKILRVPAPDSDLKVFPTDKKTGYAVVVPRDRFQQSLDDLQEQLRVLEAPLAHVQALYKIHAVQFDRVRQDISATSPALSAPFLHNDFSALLEGLRYRYAANERERIQCNKDLWISGHRVHAALLAAIESEGPFLLERNHLELFTRVYALLSRMLKAMTFVGAIRCEDADGETAY